MPANLTPQYYDAEKKFRQATSPQDKLDALKLMLAEIPKHKGTEKLQGDIKRKIAKTKSELQKSSRHGPKTHSYYVKKEGAGQVVLVGPPNAGKSSLISVLTHAKPEIADYPFATRIPCPGMMNFENIQIQLVDLPPVSREYMEFWVPNLIRTADLVALIVDLAAKVPLEQVEATRELLSDKKMVMVRELPKEVDSISIAYKKSVLFGNKFDLDQNSEHFNMLKEMFSSEFDVYPLSVYQQQLVHHFKQILFFQLQIVRVYSKPPGKQVDYNEPFILQKGSTLFDLAGAVHREFAHKLRFARVWGEGKFDGQRMNRDDKLMDGDIVELHR